MKTTTLLAAATLLLGAGCAPPLEGAYPAFSSTFTEADALHAEAIVHELVPKAGPLHYSAQEVDDGGTQTWRGQADQYGGTYRITVQRADCLFHTYLMIELLHVAYAESAADFNGSGRPGWDVVGPERRDCGGKLVQQ